MKESAIQTAIETYLHYRENLGKLVYIKNNSGAFKVKRSFVRFGKKGSSDFIIFTDGGVVFLEVKNEKGKQSPDQKEFEEKVSKLGYTYVLVRSLDEVENILKDFIDD